MELEQNNPPGKRSWTKDLWEFLCALWPNTSGYITGGSVAAIMTILSLLGVAIPHYVIWLLISIAFFASAFNAYRKQRKVVEILKINFQWPVIFLSFTIFIFFILVFVNYMFVVPLMKYVTQPSLSTDGVRLSLSDENPTTHHITYYLTVFNIGAPSVIRGWKLKVSGPDHENMFPPAALYANKEATVTNFAPSGTLDSVYDVKDSFLQNAGNPIERGGKQSGFITFVITSTSRAYLESHETKYQLSFWDINMKEYDLPPESMPPPKKQ
jgi:hypothetical protein